MIPNPHKTEEQELVEMMVVAYFGKREFEEMTGMAYRAHMHDFYKVLSVVKANIGKIATYCDCVRDDAKDPYKDHISSCKKCNGTGITLKGK